MKKSMLKIAAAGLLAFASSQAMAVVFQDGNGQWWDCTWKTNDRGEPEEVCIPLDYAPPDL